MPQSTIRYGQIIQASVVDSRGKNRKIRPLVVITQTDDISPDEPFEAVCLSTKFREYPSEYNELILGHKPGKRSIDGLSEDLRCCL